MHFILLLRMLRVLPLKFPITTFVTLYVNENHICYVYPVYKPICFVLFVVIISSVIGKLYKQKQPVAVKRALPSKVESML